MKGAIPSFPITLRQISISPRALSAEDSLISIQSKPIIRATLKYDWVTKYFRGPANPSLNSLLSKYIRNNKEFNSIHTHTETNLLALRPPRTLKNTAVNLAILTFEEIIISTKKFSAGR